MLPATAPLTALQAWVNQHPRYGYTTEAFERTPAGDTSIARLRVTFDTASTTETVHVLAGKGAGSDIRWSGGTTVEARAPGFLHMVGMHVAVRDPRILSPRGNDVRSAVFSRVVQCYADGGARVRVQSTSATQTVIVLTDASGVACGDEYGSAKVTADRLTLDATDGHPLMRERLSGTMVVERWRIEDLQTGP